MRSLASLYALGAVAIAVTAPVKTASALALGPGFAADYTISDLGPVANVNQAYGGLVFAPGAGSIYIGGDANTAAGGLYQASVTRGAGNHIISIGAATRIADAPYNDGGFAFGPGGVLFASQWPINGIQQFKPGIPGPGPDKTQDVTPLGVAGSQAALQFVPSTFGGAGQFKGLSWEGGEFYTFGIAPDGSGTYNVTSAVQETTLGGGPEGFVYVKNTNKDFAADSMLVSEFSTGNVAAYTLDASGNPIPGTRQDFVTGLTQAEGAAIDPLTGDFLFSTFGTGADRVFIVEGFVPPPPGVPELSSWAMMLIGFSLVGRRLGNRNSALAIAG